MKSLLAILVLSCVLGAGYWKMQNPEGGIADISAQASSVAGRLKAGFDTVKDNKGSSLADRQSAIADRQNTLTEQVNEQQLATDARLEAIESSLQLAQEESASRMERFEQSLAAAGTADQETVDRLGNDLDALKQQNSDQITAIKTDTAEQLESLKQSLKQSMASSVDQRLQQGDSTSQLDEVKLALITRMDELQSQVEALDTDNRTRLRLASDQSADNKATIAAISEEVDGMSSRLDTIGSALSAANTSSTDDDGQPDQSEAIEALSVRLDKRLADIESRVTAATTSNTKGTIDELQAKLREANSEIYLANSKIAELENLVNEQASSSRASMAAIQSTVSSLRVPDSKDSEKLTTEVDSLRQSVSSLSLNLDTVTADLSTLSSTVETASSQNENTTPLQPQVQQAALEVEGLKQQVASLTDEMTTMRTSLESSSIESSQTQLQQQLSKLESDVRNGPGATDINVLSNALNQSRNRIETLEQRVNVLPDSEADEAKAIQLNLQQQIAELEAKLSNTSTQNDPQLVDTLSEVQQKVSDLEQSEFVTADQLKQLSEAKSIQYKIYFDVGSTGISDAAAKVLDSVIAQESKRATGLSIFGTTDRTGPSDYNQELAVKRANRARSYLIQRGFDFTKINDVDGIGEDLAASKLPDGSDDPNQRSVIIYAFQP